MAKIKKIERKKPVVESKKKFTPKEKPIIVVEKHERERLHLQVKGYKGKKYVDFRTNYFDEEAKEWRPTKKGITIQENQFDLFVRGFLSLVETVDFRDTSAEVKILNGIKAFDIADSAGVDTEDATQTVLIFNDLAREEVNNDKP